MSTELAVLTQFGTMMKAVSERTPKRRTVLFFGRETFCDNSKYLFLHMVERCKDAEVIWVSTETHLIERLRENQLPCFDLTENYDRSVDLLLHAAVAVFCVNPSQSLVGNLPLFSCLSGAVHIQLWHGVSVKKLLLQLLPYLSTQDETFLRPVSWATRADYVLSTSPELDVYWHHVFGARTLLRGGYPRNDVIRRPATAGEMIDAVMPESAQKALASSRRKVLLVPTWQRGKNTVLSDAKFLVRLMTYARKHDLEIFYKVHPLYVYQAQPAGKQVDHLHILHAGVDVYPYLSQFDALITDYSSIMFDFLLTGKPVLTLDIRHGDHQLFEPDYSLLPGDEDFRYLFTLDNLGEILSEALNADTKQAGRQALAGRLFPECEASPALHDKILKILDEKCRESSTFAVE
ncbi:MULTISPECIES: CDP-glycerol glycerophosphotransferase family protein [Rahnella]|uniref:CDP-glycerol glycerophosphotransferase family protein n=1 Tax=Rahnella laticis TaxID=2787622 RepID=A0ABS0E072_9GAMM|nr:MULTISPECIES: CDP-glycerol glycerophosphotransferase family protein [Rahnella]MBF7978475.1 CDP-glycerol glycerophosphotransferase family protein [Rahnella laticis]MBF7998565.1 CDP-glycerol glycerophosphotransferase family protein [Rahnella sp. LAC-M12]